MELSAPHLTLPVAFLWDGVEASQGGVNGETGCDKVEFSRSKMSDSLIEAEELVDADSSLINGRLGTKSGEDLMSGKSLDSIDLREARRLRDVEPVDMLVIEGYQIKGIVRNTEYRKHLSFDHT